MQAAVQLSMAAAAATKERSPLVALDELTEDELRATLRAIANLSKGLAHLTAEAARATIEQRGSVRLTNNA